MFLVSHAKFPSKERTREKISLENQYSALRSHLSEQDFQLFTAKQISEREAKMRLRQERETVEAHLKLEERKAVKARLDVAYEELQAEHNAKEQVHAEEMAALRKEKDSEIATYMEQVHQLSLKIDEVSQQMLTLEASVEGEKAATTRLREETLSHRNAKVMAEDALRKKGKEIDELNHEVARLLDEQAALEEKNIIIHEEIENLRSQLAIANASSEDVEKLKEQLAISEQQCHEYAAELEELNITLGTTRAAKAAVEREMEALRQEHAQALDAQITAASMAASAASKRQHQLERERDLALAEKTAALEAASNVEQSVQEQLARTAEALEASMVRCESIARTVREKQARVDELEQQLTETRGKSENERAEFYKSIQEYQVRSILISYEDKRRECEYLPI